MKRKTDLLETIWHLISEQVCFIRMIVFLRLREGRLYQKRRGERRALVGRALHRQHTALALNYRARKRDRKSVV